MRQIRTVTHAPYMGSTDNQGYPTGDTYGAAVTRDSYGWYSLSSQLSTAGEYDLRVITSKVLMVPDPTVFKPRDRVALTGDDITDDNEAFFVSQDLRDYTTGPYSYLGGKAPGGEVVLEKVTG